jgi:hypothetical protein
MLKFKKYRVRRFASHPVRVLDKFPHGARFILSRFPHRENHGFLFMFCIDVIKFTARREIFTVRGEKSLAVSELVQDVPGEEPSGKQYTFLTIEMKSKFLKIKSCSGSLESSQQFHEIIQTSFYFTRLSL